MVRNEIAWVISSSSKSESLVARDTELMSILHPRVPIQTIRDLVEQLYTDKFCKLEDRLAYVFDKSCTEFCGEFEHVKGKSSNLRSSVVQIRTSTPV